MNANNLYELIKQGSTADDAVMAISADIQKIVRRAKSAAQANLDFPALETLAKVQEIMGLTEAEIEIEINTEKYSERLRYTFASTASKMMMDFFIGDANNRGVMMQESETKRQWVFAFTKEDAEFILGKAPLLTDLIIEVVK